jgi:hypothetical protein
MILLSHTAGDVYNKLDDFEMAKMYYTAALNGLDRCAEILICRHALRTPQTNELSTPPSSSSSSVAG